MSVRVPDLDAGDVGDGVERAGRAVEGHAELPGTRLVRGACGGGTQEQKSGGRSEMAFFHAAQSNPSTG